MLFVFSIMHFNGTPAISSFISKKGLTDIELPETFGELASVIKDDQETSTADTKVVIN